MLYDKSRPKHVCKLRKAIYGLKQPPRAWYNALSSFFIQFGFHNAKLDKSLFILHENSIQAYMLVYIDDFILTGNENDFLKKFVDVLSQKISL